jgi:hypothetical protein
MTTPDIIATLEAEYGVALAEKARRWSLRHPEDAQRIRDAVTAQFRPTGQPEPGEGSLVLRMIEAAVVEQIRSEQGWPTERQFVLLQAGEEPPRYVPPKLLTQPVRERHDAKAKQAGE